MRTTAVIELPIVDVFAVLRVPADADVLVIGFDDGTSLALTIPRLLREQSTSIILDDSVRLVSPDRPADEGSDVVTSMRAVRFAEFVGSV